MNNCGTNGIADYRKRQQTAQEKQQLANAIIEMYQENSDLNLIARRTNFPWNRALYSDQGDMIDVIAGPMFVCGLTEDDFGSLRGDLLEKYTEKFKHPERFMQFGDQIMAFKIPEKKQDEERTQKHHIRR